MSKRPAIDLAALTTEAAAPMTEAASGRRPSGQVAAPPPAPSSRQPNRTGQNSQSSGAGLQGPAGLPQAVPPARRRCRSQAQELLFEASMPGKRSAG